MADEIVQIKRYPNRRYYARNTSKYVSLNDIEAMVQEGATVEIRDSQSGDDITQTVLTQIIMERYPEKMSMFPTGMLHLVLRSNGAMSGLLREYFRHSLTYLDYLQQQNQTTTSFLRPMNWVRAWLDNVGAPAATDTKEEETPSPESAQLSQRIRELEERIRQLESNP